MIKKNGSLKVAHQNQTIWLVFLAINEKQIKLPHIILHYTSICLSQINVANYEVHKLISKSSTVHKLKQSKANTVYERTNKRYNSI